MYKIYKSSAKHLKFILIFSFFVVLLAVSIHFETRKEIKPSISKTSAMIFKK